MKKLSIIILVVIALISYFYFSKSTTVTASEQNERTGLQSESTRLYVDTENMRNSTLVFNCYIPSRKENEKLPVLIIVGGGQNIKGEFFTKGDWQKRAEEGRFIILAPSLKGDDSDYAEKKSFEYPSHWAGKAVKNAITMLNSKYPVDFSNINMFGHSSGAQLVHRFVLQNDGYIRKAAIHAPGTITEASEAVSANLFITLGENDGTRKNGVMKLVNSCKDRGIDVEFKEYPGVGHMISADQIEDSFKFFNY